MNQCKWTNDLYFYVTGELDESLKKPVEEHLATCSTCAREKGHLDALIHEFSLQAEFEPDEATLRALRNVVALKLRAEQARKSRRGPFFDPRPWVVPLQYVIATVILVALGFFIGRAGLKSDVEDDPGWQNLLTGKQTVETGQGAIVPYMAGIDKVKFDAKTGKVDIQYNTVNDIHYRGDLHSPVVKEVLRRAMIEENTPAVKLQAVKMVSAIAEQSRVLDPQFIQALDYLLSEDQNPGVRLMALRVLKSVTLNETIKKILLRILLYDKSLPLRIQAFETLTGKQVADEDITRYLRAVKQDTNSYLRFKADALLKEQETRILPKTGEIGRKE